MDASEKFLRFAAECESMAKFTRGAESRATWSRLAERWIRCAELVERQSAALQRDKMARRHQQPTQGRQSVRAAEKWQAPSRAHA
jgi:hypothetical protein